ncbi:MAG: hypothetical protein M0R38_12175 [Bacteroidia bacterium]|nr:hypothetical protein [Bacteroidia bacterium]
MKQECIGCENFDMLSGFCKFTACIKPMSITYHYHDKVYSNEILCSNPPQCKWICRMCGKRGTDIVGEKPIDEYQELIERWKMKKRIYSVTFNEYTNGTHNTVWNEIDDKYIEVGRNEILISEDQIEEIKKYGKGIYTLTYVGELWDGR